MTNPDLTLIAVLLDRSGSMEFIKTDMEGAFDAFIDDQREEPGQANVTLAQFDTTYEIVYANAKIGKVPKLRLLPRGGTALYDGIGRLTVDIGAELAQRSEDERPGKVIVVIITDGEENSSREYTQAAVKALITQQESEWEWTYLFLGSNIDAVQIGQSFGITKGQTMTYAASSAGVAVAAAATSGLVKTMRTNTSRGIGGQSVGYSDEDREAAMEE